jgi:hypothetical protein
MKMMDEEGVEEQEKMKERRRCRSSKVIYW